VNVPGAQGRMQITRSGMQAPVPPLAVSRSKAAGPMASSLKSALETERTSGAGGEKAIDHTSW
jgi:hypothetical protein